MGQPLSVARVKRLSRPGMDADGGTLYLRVGPSGSKSWIQRIVIDGRRRDLGLGGYPVVTLVKARDLAIDNRRIVRDGGDPLAARSRPRTPTFREGTERTIDAGLVRVGEVRQEGRSG